MLNVLIRVYGIITFVKEIIFTFLGKWNLVQLYITDFFVEVCNLMLTLIKFTTLQIFFEKLTREVYFRTR